MCNGTKGEAAVGDKREKFVYVSECGAFRDKCDDVGTYVLVNGGLGSHKDSWRGV